MDCDRRLRSVYAIQPRDRYGRFVGRGTGRSRFGFLITRNGADDDDGHDRQVASVVGSSKSKTKQYNGVASGVDFVVVKGFDPNSAGAQPTLSVAWTKS